MRCDDRPIVFISVAKLGQEKEMEKEQEQGRRKSKADQVQGWHLLHNHAGEKLVQRWAGRYSPMHYEVIPL